MPPYYSAQQLKTLKQPNQKTSFLTGSIGSSAPSYSGTYQPTMKVSPIAMPENWYDNGGVPTRTTILDSAKNFKSSGLIPSFAEAKPISGFDDSYYSNLSDQAAKRLQKQYFNDDNSILAQRENQIKRRGLFGSGIGEAATTDVYKSFGDEMADIEAQLMTKRQENDLDLSKYNTELGLKNQEAKRALAEMLLGAAGDESRSATDFDVGIFKALTERDKGQFDSLSKLAGEVRAALSEKNIDPQTRDYFESLFGTYAGNQFGYPYSQYQKIKGQ